MSKNTSNACEIPDGQKKKGQVLQCQVQFLCHMRFLCQAIFSLSNSSSGMQNMCHITGGPSSSCEMIILQNKSPGNFPAMKSAIHASFFHCASSADRKLHLQHFPEGATSWCRYMRDQANQTNYYKHEAGLPLDVIAELKPIFARLGEVSLLSRCLDGKTQN